MLDTDVFSYLWLKPRDTRASRYAKHVEGRRIAISFITLGELYFWGHKRQWAADRWAELASRLHATIVIPSDNGICLAYAALKAELSQAGVTVENNDLWIAACAVRYSLPLVTHNRAHFERIPNLVLISESGAH